MMKTKRLLAVLLTLTLAFAAFAPAALAADTVLLTVDNPYPAVGATVTVRPSDVALSLGLNLDGLSYTLSGLGSLSTETSYTIINGSLVTYKIAKVTVLGTGDIVVTANLNGSPLGTVTLKPYGSGTGTGTGTANKLTITANTSLLGFGKSTQVFAIGPNPVLTYVSSDPVYFPVSSTGVVTCNLASGAGYADITALDTAGAAATVRIFGGNYPTNTVTSLSGSTIAVGGTTQLYVGGLMPDHCGSSNPAVATVTDTGLVKGVSAGAATIYCINSAARITGQITIVVGAGGSGTGTTVTLAKSTIAAGETTVILPPAGVTLISAYSSNDKVATVTGNTVVTGVSAGTATITYITSTMASGTLTVTVTGASTGGSNLPAPSKSYTIDAGSSKTFMFSNQNVTEAWAADATVVSAALVTGSNGYKQARFTGLKAGTTTVYMKSASGAVSAITLVVKEGSVIGRTGKINTGDDDLRVIARKGAGSSYASLATLSNGVKVTIEGESGSYYKVKFTSSGKTYTGYVKKIYVTF